MHVRHKSSIHTTDSVECVHLNSSYHNFKLMCVCVYIYIFNYLFIIIPILIFV